MASLNVSNVAGLPESHRNSTLAPSQEMAYRQKCIDLKRRLSEIEANNDSLRQKLTRERHFQDKMRLNRAILLNHMKELVEHPSKRYADNKMGKITAASRGPVPGLPKEKSNGYTYDDSSDISSSDEVQEPEERPVRVKRARDGTPRTAAVVKPRKSSHAAPLTANPAPVPAYANSGLPHIAPATAFSSTGLTVGFDPHHTAFQMASSTSNNPPTPLQPHPAPHQHQHHHQSPTPLQQPPSSPLPVYPSSDIPPPQQPIRPTAPFDQFTAHLVPQLEADNIPAAEIPIKIRETWNDIGSQGQDPWHGKYGEEMMAYEKAMDEWKRAQRDGSRVTKFVNGVGGSFSAVNR